MDGAREYDAKRNMSEKDKQHMISLRWNLRNKTNEHRGKKRERERDKPRNRLLTTENTLRVTRGEVGEWVQCTMGK